MADVRYENPPSPAVLEARARRAQANERSLIRTQWFIDEVCDKVAISLERRVRIATELVKSKVVKNISRPVTKTYLTTSTGASFVRISNRSVKGEFPKADTTLLMKTIFGDVRKLNDSSIEGNIGTPLDYGLFLEVSHDRSFLVRTLNEERSRISQILSGPIL